MKVNMTPNPLDVVTIHASQGDTEARQWEFELHNNGELIDTSDVKEQLVFKTYKGGTEQLLPENGSTPTTTPILADIQYPDGLRTDQYFTYRETPTTVSNKARIKTIKGNTLVWNQLQPIPTNSSTTSNGITFTNNNDGSVTANGTATGTAIFYCNSFSLTSGHKYLFKGCPSGGTNNTYMQSIRVNSASTIIGTDVGNGDVYTANANYTDGTILLRIMSGVTLGNAKFYPQVFDLTAMGIDITDPSEFTSLFSLPYYSYNQGTLLSFNGNGIKTVGKNLFDGVLQNGTLGQNGQEQPQANRYRSGFIRVLPNTTYCSSIDGTLKVLNFLFYDGNQNFISAIGSKVVTTPSNCAYVRFFYDQTILNVNLQFEFGSVATDYEPYTSSTLSLPISTYFPTGMKRAGSVYDELTESKAITRIGNINFDDYTWTYGSTYDLWVSNAGVPDGINVRPLKNANIPFQVVGLEGNALGSRLNHTYNIWVRNGSSTVQPSGLAYYELATPTETSFTTASLVTENAEIPLSNEDGVLIGKCTEQLSENPGFFDGKIKLADGDGECYSNKIQLHIERSPQ